MQRKSWSLLRTKTYLVKYLGWRNWAVVRYNSVAENVFLIFYVCLRNRFFSWSFLVDFFVFFLFSMASTTYGYLINDLADRELDALHGKSNTFEEDSTATAVLVVGLSFLVSVFLGINFAGKRFFLALWLVWAVVATSYSVKPVRLKERGAWGLYPVVVAQRALPVLIIFSAFGHGDPWDVVFFTAYIFFRGLSSDLSHQIEDYQRDRTSGTGTYAVKAGERKSLALFRLSLRLERALLAVCLLVMYVDLRDMTWFGFSPMLVVLLAYLVLYGFLEYSVFHKEWDDSQNPFDSDSRNIFQFMHHSFPSVALPLILLFLMASQSWIFLPFLISLIVYHRLYSVDVWKVSSTLRLILAMKAYLI